MESRIKDPVNATDYTLVSLKVSSDRMTNSNKEIELKGVSIEINIFEHLEKPYLTGTVVILDNADLNSTVGFLGCEKMTVKIATDNDSLTTIEKVFYITNVANSIQANTNNKILVLDILEDIAFVSRQKRISQSYDGTPNMIIKKMLNEHLKRKLRDITISIHTDGPMRVVVPNMTPLQALSWIKDRAISENGLPFYLFSTICDDDIRFLDLEKIMENPPLNQDAMPYTYSSAYGSNLSKFNKFVQSFIIQGVKASSKVNQLQFAQEGLLSSTYDYFDTTVGFSSEEKHNIDEFYNELREKNIIKVNQSEGLIDNTSIVDDKKSHEFDTKHISQIITGNIFSDGIFNYYESKDHSFKAKKKSINRLMQKDAIDITVAGKNFLSSDKNVSIGNSILLKFMSSMDQLNLQNTTPEEEYIDHKKSGNYMIYAARHIFSGNSYNTVLSCTKISEKVANS